MRFGLIHRLMTDALATIGLLSLITSGELSFATNIFILLGLAAVIFIPEKWQFRQPMRQLSVIAPLTLLVVQIARLAWGIPVLQVAIEFAAVLQLIRLGTRRGAAHDQQVIVLSLLHLIAGTVLGTSLAYGLCFFGFLVIAPGALVLSHLRREVEGNYRQGARDRTGLPVDVPRILRSRRVIGKQFLFATCLLSIPIFIFTALIFVMFPRVGLSMLLLNQGRSERMVGFSDRVDLGGVGTLRSDPTIAMRVQLPNLPAEPPPRIALYLRGTAFDQYDGRSWSRSQGQRLPLNRIGEYHLIERLPTEADKQLKIELQPIDPPVLFLPGGAIALSVDAGPERGVAGSPLLFSGPESELRYRTREQRGLSYHVWLSGSENTLREALPWHERSRYITLPPALPDRISRLAREWVGAETNPERQAQLIETKLRTQFTYDVSSPSGNAENPLDDFLFNSKRGHCEFYSTAMAILLRTLSVPTRNVTGFAGGSYNRFGNFYAVRQGDAHSWVEVYLDQTGWTRFDPTPPGNTAPQSELTGFFAFLRDLAEASSQRWNRHVVGYDFNQQASLVQKANQSYSKYRSQSKLLSGPMGSPRRLTLLALGLVLMGLSIRWWRKTQAAKAAAGPSLSPNKSSERAIQLYEQLEAALRMRGVPRPSATPPLKHAENLVLLQHPAAEEILSLTHLYNEWRFGGRGVDAGERREFHARVERLKRAASELDAAISSQLNEASPKASGEQISAS